MLSSLSISQLLKETSEVQSTGQYRLNCHHHNLTFTFSLLPWPIPSLMHGEPANGLLVLSRAGLQGEDGTWRLTKAESWMADHPWI